MPRRQLTDRFVRAVRPDTARRLQFEDALQEGLVLQVDPLTAAQRARQKPPRKTYKLYYARLGRPRWCAATCCRAGGGARRRTCAGATCAPSSGGLSEVLHMLWDQLVDGWWHRPGEPEEARAWPGTKNGHDHRVWLSEPVRALLGELEAVAGREPDSKVVTLRAG
jgi:hypothetical protein